MFYGEGKNKKGYPNPNSFVPICIIYYYVFIYLYSLYINGSI